MFLLFSIEYSKIEPSVINFVFQEEPSSGKASDEGTMKQAPNLTYELPNTKPITKEVRTYFPCFSVCDIRRLQD